MSEQLPMPRIYGTEVEYGYLMGASNQADPDLLSRLPHGLARTLATSTRMSTNGARIYVDIGGHPEYATPECSSLDEIVAAEIAGERIYKSAVETQAVIKREGTYRLQKRAIDSSTNNYGAHESYLVGSSLRFSDRKDFGRNRLVQQLAVHYATRMALIGGGFYDLKKNRWRVGQRLYALGELMSLTCHGQKPRPLVDTRDEAHANRERWRRLHVSHADPNISPWAIRTKIGMTSAYLRLLERNGYVDDLFLEDPVEAAKIVMADTSLGVRLRLKNGKRFTALELQAEIADRVLKADAKKPLLVEDERETVERVYTDIEEARRDANHLIYKADWKTSMYIAERKLAEVSASQNSGVANATVSLMYSAITYKNVGDKEPRIGIGPQLREAGKFGDVNWVAVKEAEITPPSSTRASVRGAVILRSFDDKQRVKFGGFTLASWAKLHYENGGGVTLNNPYVRDEGERVDEILENIRQKRSA